MSTGSTAANLSRACVRLWIRCAATLAALCALPTVAPAQKTCPSDPFTLYALRDLGLRDLAASPWAAFLNNAGEIAVGGTHIWLPKAAHSLPAGWTDVGSLGFAEVRGGLDDAGEFIVPVPNVGWALWSNGKTTALNDPKNKFSPFTPVKILPDGRVLGSSTEVLRNGSGEQFAGSAREPAVWDQGVVTALPTPRAALWTHSTGGNDLTAGYVLDGNANGQYFGYVFGVDPKDDGYVIWDGGGMHALPARADFSLEPAASGFSHGPLGSINDSGQVLFGLASYASDQERYYWLYLPTPAYGLTAGLHRTTELYPNNSKRLSQASQLSHRGELVGVGFGAAAGSEQAAVVWDLHFPYGSNPASSDLPARLNFAQRPVRMWPKAVNTGGQVLSIGTNVPGSNTAQILFMTQALACGRDYKLDLASDGNFFTVTIKLTNTLDVAIHKLAPVNTAGFFNHIINGAVTLERLTPVISNEGPAEVPVGAVAQFAYKYRVSKFDGFIKINQNFTGTTDDGVTVGSNLNFLPAIDLYLQQGDLLIKKADDPDTAFALKDTNQTTATGAQIVTNAAPADSPLRFVIRVDNSSGATQDFILKAQPNSEANWIVTAHSASGDITTPVFSSTGYVINQMAANSSLLITNTLTPSGTAKTGLEKPKTVNFTLSLAKDPAVVDTVQAFAIHNADIVVNSTADTANLDLSQCLSDCLCDTGKKLADGITPECTLRAAIQVANKRPGKDAIKFKISNDGNEFEGDVPTILPATELPKIAERVAIDGWSQMPSSQYPPVQIAGRKMSRTTAPTCHDHSGSPAIMDETDIASGLTLLASDCEVRGLVINHFPLCGILVDGLRATIQGNFLGVTPSGTFSRGNGFPGTVGGNCDMRGAQLCIRSSGCQVGGLGVRLRNVISGGSNYMLGGKEYQTGWKSGAPGIQGRRI